MYDTQNPYTAEFSKSQLAAKFTTQKDYIADFSEHLELKS